jgi:hypothetical protein
VVGLRITWTNGPEIPGGDILETLGIDNACQSAQVIDFPQGRGDRAVEGARLEIVCTPNKGTGGSNPPLSAITKRRVVAFGCSESGSVESEISGCRLLIVRSCARQHREPRQVRKEAAVPDKLLCHRVTWLSAMGISRPVCVLE